MVGLIIPLVPVIGLDIEAIFDLPICETLYFVCYLIDKNKDEENRMRQIQQQIKRK